MDDRPARTLVSLGIAALVALVAAAPSGFSDEAENYRRLQSMPVERRADLAENLARFDRLDPKEQAGLRKLDADLSRKDPVDQAKYRAILRRYHLWVNGLTDEQKAKLAAASGPAERFEVARKIRVAEGVQSRKGPRLSGIRIGNYALDNPTEAAFLLRIWEKLTPAEQAEIAKRSGRQLRDQIRNHRSAVHITRDHALLSEESAYTARLEADPDYRAFLAGTVKRMAETTQKKAETATRKNEAAARKAGDPLRRMEQPYAAFLYFEDHPSKPIPPGNLDRFVASLPAWFLAMLDPLTAEDARDYLTVVYRQLYPYPDEMPDPARAKSTPKPAPRITPGQRPPG